jgi:putative transposase
MYFIKHLYLHLQDCTVVQLHEKLAKIWPAMRSRKVAAGVRISVLTSTTASGPKSVALYAKSANDSKTLRIGS